MEKNKKHIIFDLDDTLWDYQQNSEDTLLQLCGDYQLIENGVEAKRFIEVFRIVNNGLWDQFDRGEITRDVIRKERFPSIFNKLNLNLNGIAMQMQDSFMEICAAKPKLVHGVKEVLEEFNSKYTYHILSNGFDEIQFTKIESAGIGHYFDQVITSGSAGYRKPEPEIFDYILDKIGTTKTQCVMIGDNPLSDIEGAHRYGMDQVYYNVHKKACAVKPTHTINNFDELLSIL